MKERPILMSTENVKAILEGRKTQTRRVITESYKMPDGSYTMPKSRYGQVGDRLWVRETWFPLFVDNAKRILYLADSPNVANPVNDKHWKPSIFMPRWASRIILEVTEIRVERLQEITYGDVKSEGIVLVEDGSLRGAIDIAEQAFNQFKKLWDSLNAKYPWESNPWIWVISFKRVT